MKKVLTLCMVLKDNQILLGMKKRGFGAGRWNGFGGKLEESEIVEDGALRELEEEVGIKASAMKKVGILDFSFENDPKILEVHIFKVLDYTGEPTESEEMRPQWFSFENIPFDQMWSDDIFWLPLLLKNKLFKGNFLFDRPSDAEYSAKIINQNLEEVLSL
ncbi:MAG: 8-oxo-dGTP diphosphatase [Candidatus Nomurabacteria bacterium]|nr:8-oxo-dGTP diphosphatase [Candidatus Nomurabacteria bacterium]